MYELKIDHKLPPHQAYNRNTDQKLLAPSLASTSTCLTMLTLLTFLLVFSSGICGDSWWLESLKNNRNPWGTHGENLPSPYSQNEKFERSASSVLGAPESACDCVEEYQCSNGKIITDGRGLVNFRSKSTCPSDKVHCCLESEDKDLKEVGTGEGKSDNKDDAENGDNYDDDDDKKTDSFGADDFASSFTNPVQQEQGVAGTDNNFRCGVRTLPLMSSLKVSGNLDETETMQGDFPWTLLIKYRIPSDDGDRLALTCGASLILPSVAVTAAHCLEHIPTENLVIRAGEWDLADEEENISSQDRKVKEVIIHPKYDSHPIMYDIAILLLNEAFKSNAAVNTICLPTKEEKFKWSICYATGWGAKQENEAPSGDQILRKARLPLVPHDVCQEQFRKTRLGSKFRLHKSFLCAGGNDIKDTCKGDGGGPLACQDDSPPYNFYLVGITSWGVGCSNKGIPGAYTDVIEMSDWITSTVNYLIKQKKIPSL